MNEINRREFVLFMGRGLAVAAASQGLLACAGPGKKAPLPFHPIPPTKGDELTLAEGFRYDIILRYGQSLNKQGTQFGFNNDFLAYTPLDRPNEGLLWVNHEYHDPYFNSGWRVGMPRTKAQVQAERRVVGGSIVHLRNDQGLWKMVDNSPYNRRLDAFTPIRLISEDPILGKRTAIGTFGNCAGGQTSWGTILTCEENYMNFIGEVHFKNGERQIEPADDYLGWLPHADLPPEHYGWVVEVNPRTGQAKKLTGLGRFAHECATTTLAADGRTVVYSGDDSENEHLYKFIADKPGSLETGELFVADTVNGRWLSLAREKDERLRQAFKSRTECLIRTREAAKLVGATPLDRPEDIEVDPATRAVFVSLSMNKSQRRPFGAIMKLEEKNRDPLSLEFRATTFAAGGPDNGFACPDNLVFDPRGNLWMCTDISGSSTGRAPYESFGNNGLFYIPLSGPSAGRALQVASAPWGAELTGPIFMPDGSLMLSVQHPGERAHDKGNHESHWPDGGQSVPAPCVVQIRGATLERLIKG